MASLVALGDSFSCGEGVGVRVPVAQTWSTVIARHTDLSPLSLARPGARVRDLREHQLPVAPDAPVATVLAGLNDVCRGAFDPHRIAEDFYALVEGLLRRADVVLVGRLHDATRFLWLPKRLRHLVRGRTDAVNAAIDEVAHESRRVSLLDLAAIDALQWRCAWAADGVHPTSLGHMAIAAAAADALRQTGHAVAPLSMPATTRGATQVHHAYWLARHGLPYLMRNARAFATPVAEGLHHAG